MGSAARERVRLRPKLSTQVFIDGTQFGTFGKLVESIVDSAKRPTPIGQFRLRYEPTSRVAMLRDVVTVDLKRLVLEGRDYV